MSTSSRLSLIFSCAGHAYIHIFTAFYFVIVLALENDWQLPYHELVELWTLGALLVGLAALPAGWLGDKWSSAGMMSVFFIGIGVCSVLAGYTNTPAQLVLCLGGIGLFAAIYHPVGIPWLVRAGGKHRGKLLGLNGVFGTLGAAMAGLVAGSLIDLDGWRTAFIVPGIVSIMTGLILIWCLLSGRIIDEAGTTEKKKQVSISDRYKAYSVLLFTMFAAGVVYHSTQTSLPKLFELRHDGLVGESALGIGVLVAIVYTVAAVTQMAGGWLADKYPLKLVYFSTLALQIPFLFCTAYFVGLPLVLAAIIMVMFSVSALPAENMLLAHFTPANRHGLVFGVKFVLAFGAGPIAVQMVARISGTTGEFYWVFITLASIGVCITLAASLLPRVHTATTRNKV